MIPIEDYSEAIMVSVGHFVGRCLLGIYSDEDGYGHPVYPGGQVDNRMEILPSKAREIPAGATHVLWFAKWVHEVPPEHPQDVVLIS